jgi:hypothetical protein
MLPKSFTRGVTNLQLPLPFIRRVCLCVKDLKKFVFENAMLIVPFKSGIYVYSMEPLFDDFERFRMQIFLRI